MLFVGILIALLTISASTRDVGTTTKAGDGNLAGAPMRGAATLASGHCQAECNLYGRQDTLYRYISRYFEFLYIEKCTVVYFQFARCNFREHSDVRDSSCTKKMF